MLNFIGLTETAYDTTRWYEVKTSRECTVKEFIDTILKERSKEFGFIRINNSVTCQYEYGEIVLKNCLLENEMSRPVAHVQSHGGWNNMDYSITTK